ncbi:hypothetical protein QBC37DRAFT_181663 [Rhypophila decipiens]|uniref:F-box domain-containing protein n=1 Tax=Rhypophila decipiens TaxID=261697 RepID=A0AAN6Y7Y3_9PEZI|nr:hypothetical protein QBC37DRAFT_181663 [Rhypophila decipiens]
MSTTKDQEGTPASISCQEMAQIPSQTAGPVIPGTAELHPEMIDLKWWEVDPLLALEKLERVESSKPADSQQVPTDNTPRTLQECFFSLPLELAVGILGCLPFDTLLSLRLTSRTWNRLIVLNESLISQHYLQNGHLPPIVTQLLPSPGLAELSLRYIAGVRYRFSLCSKVAACTTERFMPDYEFPCLTEVTPETNRRRRRFLKPRSTLLLFVASHYLDMYRKELYDHASSQQEPSPISVGNNVMVINNTIQTRILRHYTSPSLLMHLVWTLRIVDGLLGWHFTAQLDETNIIRSPSGCRRSSSKPPPTLNARAAILCIGGIPLISKIVDADLTCEDRLALVNKWYNGLTETPPPLDTSISVKPADGQSATSIEKLGSASRKLSTRLRKAWTLKGNISAGRSRKTGLDPAKNETNSSSKSKPTDQLEVHKLDRFPGSPRSSLADGPALPEKIPANVMKQMLKLLPTSGFSFTVCGDDAMADVLAEQGALTEDDKRGMYYNIHRRVIDESWSFKRVTWESLFDGLPVDFEPGLLDMDYEADTWDGE